MGDDSMTTYLAPICLGCTHLRIQQPDQPLTCDAYPNGIPQAILHSGVDHRTPQPGDHGITFEPKDADAAEYADLLFETLRDAYPESSTE